MNAISLEDSKIAKIRGESVVLLSYYRMTFKFECKSEEEAEKWLLSLNKAKKEAIISTNEMHQVNQTQYQTNIIPFTDKRLTMKELNELDLNELNELIGNEDGDKEDKRASLSNSCFISDLDEKDYYSPLFQKKNRPVTLRELVLDFDFDDDIIFDILNEPSPSNHERDRAVTLKENNVAQESEGNNKN